MAEETRVTIQRSVVLVHLLRQEHARTDRVSHRSTLFVQVCSHKCHNFVYLWLGEPRNLPATTFRQYIYLLFAQRWVTGTTGVQVRAQKLLFTETQWLQPGYQQFRKLPINMRNDMKWNVSFWSREKCFLFLFFPLFPICL